MRAQGLWRFSGKGHAIREDASEKPLSVNQPFPLSKHETSISLQQIENGLWCTVPEMGQDRTEAFSGRRADDPFA